MSNDQHTPDDGGDEPSADELELYRAEARGLHVVELHADVHEAIDVHSLHAARARIALDELLHRIPRAARGKLPPPTRRAPLSPSQQEFRDRLLAQVADVTVEGGPLEQRTTAEIERIAEDVRRAQESARAQDRQTALDLYHQRWCEVYAGIVAQLAPRLAGGVGLDPSESYRSLDTADERLRQDANAFAVIAGVLCDEALKVEIDRTTRGPR